MEIPKNAVVAVADGEILSLFRNAGDAGAPRLMPLTDPDVDADNAGSGGRHHNSAANPSESQLEEDNFAAGIVDMLNRRVLADRIEQLVVVAAPRTLGEMRKHYHKELTAVIVGEIDKDLTGHSIADIETVIAAA